MGRVPKSYMGRVPFILLSFLLTSLSPCRDRSVESSAPLEAIGAKMNARMEALMDQMQEIKDTVKEIKAMKAISEGVESGASGVVAAPAPVLKPSLGHNCTVINAANLLYIGHGDLGPYNNLNYKDYIKKTSGCKSSLSKAKTVFNSLIKEGGFDPIGFSDLNTAARTERVREALRNLQKSDERLKYVIQNTLMVSTVYGYINITKK
jgi:hypothetical protein